MKENHVIITALASSEKQATQKLSECASKGLLLVDFKVPMLSYRFSRQEKQEVDYLIDFSAKANSAYFDDYREHGWEHVFSYEHLHYFKAEKGTTAFNTDVEGKVQRYLKESKHFAKYTLFGLVPALLFGFLLMTFQTSGDLITLPLFVLTFFSVMSVVFCIMPTILYFIRAKRL